MPEIRYETLEEQNRYEEGEIYFGDWEIVKLLGAGSYGRVFLLEKTDYDITMRSALKVIRIPADQQETRLLRSEGMSAAEISQYYEKQLENAAQEIRTMLRLQHPNVVRCEDFRMFRYQGTEQWDVLIRMELLTALPDWLADRAEPLSSREVGEIGLSLSRALEACANAGMLHRDIKPENVFVEKHSYDAGVTFKLGDFGAARLSQAGTMGMSRQGTELYMAPEMLIGMDYDGRVDIYSLGLLLYQLANGNRPAFYPTKGAVSFEAREQARRRRMRGEGLPPAMNADAELMAIIAKACAYKAEDRFANAGELRQALEAYVQGGTVTASPAPKQAEQVEEEKQRAETARREQEEKIRELQAQLEEARRQAEAAEQAREQIRPADEAQERAREKAADIQLSVGGFVRFGSYPQGDPSGIAKEPIAWQVVAIRGGEAILVSWYALDCVPYHSADTAVTWEGCALRKWLNEDFFWRAFTSAERDQIQTTAVSNPNNTQHGTAGGEMTADKVFLLSLNEAGRYLKDKTACQAQATAYAQRRGVYTEDGGCRWWLRSPGKNSDRAAQVFSDGAISAYGPLVNYANGGVRPAITVRIRGNDQLTVLEKRPEPIPQARAESAAARAKEPETFTQSRAEPAKQPETPVTDDVSGNKRTATKTYAVGDVLQLGRYVQSDAADAAPEPIDWVVLEQLADGSLLLLSRLALDVATFNNKGEAVSWKDCTLREHLNTSFLVKAFSAQERQWLRRIELQNTGNGRYGTLGCGPTEDTVFPLSIDEAMSYMKTWEKRKVPCTPYVKAKLPYGGCVPYWLRSPGWSERRAAIVDGVGDIIHRGKSPNDIYAIRPAIIVDPGAWE